jgi:virulence-associated protein VapD
LHVPVTAKAEDVTMDFPWHDSRLVAPSTLHHFRVGGLPAVFCEKRQKLFGLNATADFIWQSLATGRTPAEVSFELADMGFSNEEAAVFVSDATTSWLNAGQLTPQDVLDQLAQPAAAIRDVRIHDLTARITFLGRASDEAFDDVFGHLAADVSTPVLGVSVVGCRGSFFTFEDGVSLGSYTADGLIPHLKAVLTEHYVSSVGNAFLIHGALLVRRNRGLLICGSPGAGKTTLCIALVGSGYEYCSDDIVRFQCDATANGVPFAPAVKQGAWPLVAPYAPTIDSLPTYRRGDGQAVRYLPMLASTRPRVISNVVLLARQVGVPTALESVAPLEMVSTILESAYSAKRSIDADTLKTFARATESAGCHRLVYSALPDAVDAIGSLAHE